MLIIKFEDGKTWNEEKKAFYEDGAFFRENNGAFVGGAWIASEQRDLEYNGQKVFCGCMHGSLTGSKDDTLDVSSNEMQWPMWLTRLSEKIFEGLPEDERHLFPRALIKSVPCNVDYHDLSRVNSIVTIKRLTWLLEKIEMRDQQREAIQGVIDLYKRDSEAADAYAAHAAARAADAYAAAYSAYAAYAAYSASVVAADAADAAAYAAYFPRAVSSNYYTLERDWLIEAMGEIKGGE